MSTSPAGPQRRTPPRHGYWVPAAIALAVLVAIGGAVGAGDLSHSAPRTLQGQEVALQLALDLSGQAGYRGSLPHVVCPPSEPARRGLAFECSVQQDGRSRGIAVVETDARGGVRWRLVGGDNLGRSSARSP